MMKITNKLTNNGTNEQQTNNKQITTNKKEKNDKNIKNIRNNIILSDAITSDNIVIELPTNKFKKSNETFKVTESFIKEMQEIYGNVNVLQQLKQMKAWLLTNENKRKTVGGMKRFINYWLSKKQNQYSEKLQDKKTNFSFQENESKSLNTLYDN